MTKDLVTSDSLEYTYHPVTTGSMVFKVQAANDAHIALASGPTDGGPMYEIFIGGWGNAKTAIRKNQQKPDKAVVDTPNILSASEPRCFWVRWSNGLIVMGKEGQAAPFIEWQDADPDTFGIGCFGICTGWGASGVWNVEDGNSSKQIETPDELKYQWLPVQQGCLKVEVRCPHNAHLALSCGPCDSDPMYEVLLGGWENSASVIRYRREKPDKVRENTPAILSRDEFRSFCVAWKNGHIWVTDGSGKGLLEWKDPSPFGISHFGVRTAWGSTGQWKVCTTERPDFPPPSQSGRVTSEPMNLPGWAVDRGSAGVATWVDCTHGVVPPGAVPAGIDGEQLYVARARHAGDIIPGKLVPSHKVCYVSWGGNEHAKTEYQVLCNCNPVWTPAANGRIPVGALPAGETEQGEPLFIGRASHNGVICVGKVHQSYNRCYVPYAGKEIEHAEYEVLCAQ